MLTPTSETVLGDGWGRAYTPYLAGPNFFRRFDDVELSMLIARSSGINTDKRERRGDPPPYSLRLLINNTANPINVRLELLLTAAAFFSVILQSYI